MYVLFTHLLYTECIVNYDHPFFYYLIMNKLKYILLDVKRKHRYIL